MKDFIPVTFCCDNNFAPYLSVTIRSLADHTKENLIIYIFDFGIKTHNKFLIKFDLKKFKNIQIKFVKIDKKRFNGFPVKDSLPISMYGRYLIPEILSNYEKVIYSDVDVIFTGDIKKLYDVDLCGKPLGAVPSQRYRITDNYKRLKRKLGLSNNHKFFMSGLLLINTKVWIKNKFTDKLLEKTFSLKDIVTLPDQEILNKVFEENYKELDPIFCVIYKIFNFCYQVDEREYLEKNKVIVHYPGKGRSKPWNNRNLLSGDYWWHYAKDSSFYNLILKKNHEFEITNKKEDSILSRISKLERKISQQERYIETLNQIIQYYIKPERNIYIRNKLRKLQECDVLALSIFQKICKQQNITFWLDFGSLLGAIRNSGFIPWDDDIDIGICREDYDRIANGLYKEFERNGLNVNFGSNYYFKIIRITYKDQPIQIDLWPYDYCSSPLSDDNIMDLKNKILCCLEEYKNIVREKSKFYLNTSQSEIVKKIQDKIIWKGKPGKIEFGLFSGCDSLGYNKPRVFAYDLIFPLREHKFETLDCPVPNKFHEYLTAIYGQYNIIPDFSNSEMLQHDNIQKNLVDLDWEFDELKLLEGKFNGN